MSSKIERKLLRYTGKAIGVFNLIKKNDRILVCLSGGKDSFAMVQVLHLLKARAKIDFDLHVLVVDKGIPGWNREEIESWLKEKSFDFTILTTEIFKIVKEKERAKDTYCILCSRLRRGHIYTFAKKNNYNKIALGHHRDDLITSLLMSIFYNGNISSMPSKLLTDDEKLVVIRPLVYCQEKDIIEYAKEQKLPLTPEGICSAKETQIRSKTEDLIKELARSNSKIPSNILHALSDVRSSHLMDQKLWDFKNIEELVKDSHE